MKKYMIGFFSVLFLITGCLIAGYQVSYNNLLKKEKAIELAKNEKNDSIQTRRSSAKGESVSDDAYYLKALRTKALIKREFDRAFEKYDLILGPTAPTTAPELGKSLDDPMKMYLGDIYTISVNLAGLPGMSVPVGKDSKGLPVGMQLIGNVFDEKTLIRAAYTYECATKKVHEVPAQIGRTAEKEVQ